MLRENVLQSLYEIHTDDDLTFMASAFNNNFTFALRQTSVHP